MGSKGPENWARPQDSKCVDRRITDHTRTARQRQAEGPAKQEQKPALTRRKKEYSQPKVNLQSPKAQQGRHRATLDEAMAQDAQKPEHPRTCMAGELKINISIFQ